MLHHFTAPKSSKANTEERGCNYKDANIINPADAYTVENCTVIKTSATILRFIGKYKGGHSESPTI